MNLEDQYKKAVDLYYEKFKTFPLQDWGRAEEDYHTEKFINLLYKAINENDKTIAEDTFPPPPRDVLL